MSLWLGILGGQLTAIPFVRERDIAIASKDIGGVEAYPWSTSAGFGTRYADHEGSIFGYGFGVAFSPSGNTVAVGHSFEPRITAFPWSAGFGTKYADPATLPAGNGRGVAFSPSGNDIAVAHTSSPYITAYPWSAGFGTKYANPATLPWPARGVEFSPSGNAIAIAHLYYRVTVYPWSSGFGTKYADPATFPYGDGYSVAFSPN